MEPRQEFNPPLFGKPNGLIRAGKGAPSSASKQVPALFECVAELDHNGLASAGPHQMMSLVNSGISYTIRKGANLRLSAEVPSNNNNNNNNNTINQFQDASLYKQTVTLSAPETTNGLHVWPATREINDNLKDHPFRYFPAEHSHFNADEGIQLHEQAYTYSYDKDNDTFNVYMNLTNNEAMNRDVDAILCANQTEAQKDVALKKKDIIAICKVCNRELRNMTSVRRHKYCGQKRYTCKYCCKAFRTMCYVKVHERLHSGEKPYKCMQCEKSFISQAGLALHNKAAHVSIRAFVCDRPNCKSTFRTKSHLTRHVKVVHEKAQNVVDVRSFVCNKPNCGSAFRTRAHLNRHDKVVHQKGTHVEPGTFMCDKPSCGSGFHMDSLLNNHHADLVHPDVNVVDPQLFTPNCASNCASTFAAQSQLNRHVGLHLDHRTLCEQCGKGVNAPPALKLHDYTHLERNINCEVCTRKFKPRYNMKSHMERHEGARQYSCNVCNKAFKAKVGLLLHMRTHTGETPVKPFQCRLCDKRFTQRVSVTAHERVHTGERPYQCQLCSNTFMHNRELKMHQQKCFESLKGLE